MKLKRNFGIILTLLLLFVGCAGVQTNIDTTEKKVLFARQELNTLLTEYIQIQDIVSQSDHEKIKTCFIAAGVIVDQMQSSLDVGAEIETTDYDKWIETKDQLLKLLLEVSDAN